MSDTSILTAIKYKGKMIGIPQDSSVSWNDLTDKPVVIDTSTQTVWHYYDIASYQPIRNLKQSGYGWGDNSVYYGVFLKVEKASITNAINALSSQLTNDQKNIWQIEFSAYEGPHGQPEYSATAVIDIKNEEVRYFNADFGLTLRSDVLDDDGDGYWKILVNDPQEVLDDETDVTVDVIPVNFITRDGQTVTSLTYTETITVPGQWYFDPDHVKKDASLGILWDTSAGPDLSDYYTKTQIDTSIANNYASKSDVSAFITSNDISTFVTDNDISTFITANDVSTKLEANDVSQFITANDVSIYLTDNDISTFITANDVSIYSTNTYVNSTFAKISYISQSDYDNLSVKDPSTLYIIPS